MIENTLCRNSESKHLKKHRNRCTNKNTNRSWRAQYYHVLSRYTYESTGPGSGARTTRVKGRNANRSCYSRYRKNARKKRKLRKDKVSYKSYNKYSTMEYDKSYVYHPSDWRFASRGVFSARDYENNENDGQKLTVQSHGH